MATSKSDATTKKGEKLPSLIQRLENDLMKFVYDSNFIEVTGSDFKVTERICHKIFRGEEVVAKVEPQTEEYELARAALITLNRPYTEDEIIQSRQEIINHATALKYAINYFIVEKGDITEGFLKEVHTRLCAGSVLGEDAGKPGQYRTWEIAARHGKDMKQKSIFIRASTVPAYMASFVEDLAKDIATVETRVEDPFDMASRYSHRFVCIHPFGDGNGRMCRIILNLILLRYVGYVISFGGTETEREKYLDIARRSNKKFHEEDMEVPEEEKEGHWELKRFISAKVVAPESLLTWKGLFKTLSTIPE
ncbi:Fic-domain-containing protein [Hypomontagnella monticulosa]|nr:Fic-domain-containing protein [Hypomontagnella monticulosa]